MKKTRINNFKQNQVKFNILQKKKKESKILKEI